MRHSLIALLTLSCCLSGLLTGQLSGQSVYGEVDIPDKEYVRAVGDHLELDGQPVRFWGAIGSFPSWTKEKLRGGKNIYEIQDEAIRRVKKVGFNMFRIWHLKYDDNAKKGDGSGTDISDYFMAKCKEEGIRIWAAGFGGGRLYEKNLNDSVKIIDEPATEAEWIESVKSMSKVHYWSKKERALQLKTVAVAWDPRLEKLAIAQMKAKANHVNLYTGIRHADDPTIAVWELTNEQWWMSRMMGGQWLKLPAYFRASLIAKWNDWLAKKYTDDNGLKERWGFLFPGETLANKSVLLAPMKKSMTAVKLNDTNPHAIAAFETVSSKIGRRDVNARRGEDVIEFLLDVIVSHKLRWKAELKTWGKSTRLSPVILDTGIGQSIQAQYMQNFGEAVSHASYMEGVETNHLNKNSKRYPFYSGLDSFPQMCKDVPWLEHNRPTDKPFLCYETQFGSPSPYRAEWPIRIASLGSIQDWSAACFHYFHFNHYDFSKEKPYSGRLAQPGPGAYQYDYTTDEIEQANMRVAGAVFRNHLVAKAPNPTHFVYGKPALVDPRSMDYGNDYDKLGLMNMMTTTYTNGMRLTIDPNQKEFLKTTGKVVRFNGFEKPNPVKPSDQIYFDYQKGHVKMDSPGVASYTGFFSQYGESAVGFENGVSLSEISHVVPEGTFYPRGAEERYTSFTLASEDGRSLGTTKKAVIALVGSSFNTDLGFTTNKDGKIKWNWGKEPVLVTRLGATVTAPALAGMQYKMIDFNENVLAEGTVGADGKLVIPNDKPIWVTELSR